MTSDHDEDDGNVLQWSSSAPLVTRGGARGLLGPGLGVDFGVSFLLV